MRSLFGRVAPLLVVGLCGSVSSGAQTPQPPRQPEAAAVTTLTATVRAVDAGTRTLRVLTGVGPALRVVTLACDESVTVRSGAGEVSLYQLKPGDLVRVEYSKGPTASTARTIEVLEWPRDGGVR
jgi:hypothetical protein